jgi:hypothetical protein
VIIAWQAAIGQETMLPNMALAGDCHLKGLLSPFPVYLSLVKAISAQLVSSYA